MPTPDDYPPLPAQLEARYLAWRAHLRRTCHVDAWAQRTVVPPGSRCEDWAPLDSLPTHREVYPTHKRARVRQRKRDVRRTA